MKFQTFLLAAGWTLFLLLLGVWFFLHELEAARTLARGEAKAHFRKDQAFRLWASVHGGVYVPDNARTPPNPSLAHIPDRDIQTKSGKHLTLMNPAYMLRQMMDEYGDMYGIKGRIVSDKPLRAANAPDPWEQEALDAFRRGETKAEAFHKINGEQYLQWMEPMFVEESCLKCHGHQGYKAGDVRGGVGISVPMAPYMAEAWMSIRYFTVALGAAWLFGLGGIGLAQLKIDRRIRERRAAEQALQDERNLFLAGPTMVFRWRATQGWPVLYVSDNVRQILGWSSEELIDGNKPYRDLIHPDDLQRVAAEVDLHTRSGDTRFEHEPYRLRRKDGGFVWVADYTTIPINSGESAKHYHGYIVDISSQYESEQRLKLAIEGTNAGLWDWHLPSGEIVFNEQWAEIAGYSLNELEPTSIQTWIDLCHPDDLKQSNEQLEEHFLGKTDCYRCEVRMKHKDGSWVWVLDQGKVVERDGEGKPLRVAGTHIDITKEKRSEALLAAERDLAASWAASSTFDERLTRCLLTAIRVAAMDCGVIYLVNEDDGSFRLAVWQGLSEASFEQSMHLRADSDEARSMRHNKPVYKYGCDLKEKAAAREGLRAIAILPVSFQDKVIACLKVASHHLDYMSDQTRSALESIALYIGAFVHQEIQAENIRRQHRDILALFNTIEDMLFILDTDGRIIAHNRILGERLEYTADELIGKHIHIMHPEERHDQAQTFLSSIMKGEAVNCAIPLQTRSGLLIPVETKGVRGYWQGRNVIFGVSRDISERLEADRRRWQIEKAESLARMAGAVAHHFNNQLMAVLGNLDLAREEVPPQAEIVKYLSDAERAAQSATEMSSTMLTLLGQVKSKLQIVDLSQACRVSLSSCAKYLPPHTDLETDLPLPGPAVKADEAQLGQVLKILMVNGGEAKENAPVRIRIAVDVADKESLGSLQCYPPEWTPTAGRYACLRVEDNGRGMDEHTISKIFDPFFTDKFPGRGLGLAMALGIVKSWNGCITVESARGCGSIFRVYLPLSTED